MPSNQSATDSKKLNVTIDLRDGLQQHRSALKDAMSKLELALARPAGGELQRWLSNADEQLDVLRKRFHQHVEVNEGAGSFHEQVAGERPELVPKVKRLQRDHVRAASLIEELKTAINDQRRAGSVDAPDVQSVRMIGTDLLLLLIHHRQRGADLAWESLNLDLGGTG